MLVRRLRQRGDTIVEVMIVLTVLGSAIGISYSTANRSLLNARQAQENSEATKIAQRQAEALYTLSKYTNSTDVDHYLYVDKRTFCIKDNGTPEGAVQKFTAAVTDATIQKDIDYTNFPSACTQSGLYHYSVKYTASDNDKFSIVVVWDDVLGQGKDTVTLNYRIHKPVVRDDL